MRKISLILFLILLLSGCGQEAKQVTQNRDLLKQDWSKIEQQAKGTEIHMYMWGGDSGVNSYMDKYVAPKMKEKYGIKFVRVPMNAPDFIQKLLAEKQAQNNKGTMDIIWINGENFKNAKNKELLYAPFVQMLPNYKKYIDTNGLEVKYDFGTPVNGLEAPWGKVQFVYLYDSAKVPNPPQSFKELAQWVKQHPGKFTYPDPSDFTGNAFLRHLLYDTVGLNNLMSKGFDESMVNQQSEPMWNYLKSIKPYLWREGTTYPQGLAQLDQMYSKGEVLMTMGYNEARAEALIKQGVFPPSTRSFVMESPGSIGNTHFLAIPYNSPNPAAAMVTINFLLSPEAQLAKMDPKRWGDTTVLDPAKLDNTDQKSLTQLKRGSSVLAAPVLKKAFKPEIDPSYVDWVKEKWMNEVVQGAN